MKKIFLHIVIIFTSVIFVNSQEFTGIVQFQNENFEAGEKSNITCYLKSPLCKMDISSTSKEGSTQYTLYFDDTNSDVIMIAGGNKTIIPSSSITENKHLQNIFYATNKESQLNIAGFNCNEVQLKTTTSAIQCYVTNELDINFPLLLNTHGIINALKENNIKGIPLNIEVKDLSGKNLFNQNIVSVERKNLNDSELKAR